MSQNYSALTISLKKMEKKKLAENWSQPLKVKDYLERRLTALRKNALSRTYAFGSAKLIFESYNF